MLLVANNILNEDINYTIDLWVEELIQLQRGRKKVSLLKKKMFPSGKVNIFLT